MFDLTVISPKRVVFDDGVDKLWVDGDDSEYEFLSFHANCIGLLRKGLLIINDKKAIPINKGVVQFANNKCTVIIEE